MIEIKKHERKILNLCVNKSGFPRQDFVKAFQNDEISPNGSISKLSQQIL